MTTACVRQAFEVCDAVAGAATCKEDRELRNNAEHPLAQSPDDSRRESIEKYLEDCTSMPSVEQLLVLN